MRIASVASVKAQFSAFIKASEKGPVVVTRNGRPVAALVSITDDDELEDLLLAYSPKFRTILETAEQQIKRGEEIPHEEFWREMEESRDETTAPPVQL